MIKVPLFSLFLSVFFLLLSLVVSRAKEENNVYVVYMGAAGRGREEHLELLSSVLEREDIAVEDKLLHSYKHGFSGFVAHLSEHEAASISKKESVISVFIDPILELHTTRSWDFLQLQTDLETSIYSKPTSNVNQIHGSSTSTTVSEDTIIGILDTGIWPESESFSDKGMGPIPTKWKGVCMEGHDFNATNCNKKLIGARYYNGSNSGSGPNPNSQTARDSNGHGSHTASIAAGRIVEKASYYGLAPGIAKGGSPSSRLAIYKVCELFGCLGSAILAAFDDAVGDGVDVLSASLGFSAYSNLEFYFDPIAIGAFHAVENGIIVVCSAGNEGPEAGTIVNTAPWILTVGATTIDRDFESNVILGGNKVIKGEAINFSDLQKSPIYPLIDGRSAKSNASSADDASDCDPDALDEKKIEGKIVFCNHQVDSTFIKQFKIEKEKSKGALGLILVDDSEKAVTFLYGTFPKTVVSSKAADEIQSYIKSTREPVATILPSVTVIDYKPAPAVPYFSSRGPSPQTGNILKPDVAAPGVTILAAWTPTHVSSDIPPGQKPSPFNLLSGTSMSCPHVSGIAATIKAKNPTWTPSAIKSAIMTTATQINNEKAPLTDDSGATATPHGYGAGEVNPLGALQPGLVYETQTSDYLKFLCNYGYNTTTIKKISKVLPDDFDCPKGSSKGLISNLNYASIAISNFDGKQTRKVSRTVTNVGADEETVYLATIKSPDGLDVKVIPDKLHFTKNVKRLSYQVAFSSSTASVPGNSVVFGFITWSDGKHKVRTVFVVSGN